MLAAIRKILEDNRLRREGRAPVRALEDGEVVFKIPTSHYKYLQRTNPDLFSKDHDTRLFAWHKFRQSPEAEKYLVTRTPRQVRASNNHRIIVK